MDSDFVNIGEQIEQQSDKNDFRNRISSLRIKSFKQVEFLDKFPVIIFKNGRKYNIRIRGSFAETPEFRLYVENVKCARHNGVTYNSTMLYAQPEDEMKIPSPITGNFCGHKRFRIEPQWQLRERLKEHPNKRVRGQKGVTRNSSTLFLVNNIIENDGEIVFGIKFKLSYANKKKFRIKILIGGDVKYETPFFLIYSRKKR